MWLKVLGPLVFAHYGTLQMLTKISQCWHSLTPQGVSSSTAEQSPSGRLQMKSWSNVQSLWVLESIVSPCEKKLFRGGGRRGECWDWKQSEYFEHSSLYSPLVLLWEMPKQVLLLWTRLLSKAWSHLGLFSPLKVCNRQQVVSTLFCPWY